MGLPLSLSFTVSLSRVDVVCKASHCNQPKRESKTYLQGQRLSEWATPCYTFLVECWIWYGERVDVATRSFRKEEVVVLQRKKKKKTFTNNSGWNMRRIAARVTVLNIWGWKRNLRLLLFTLWLNYTVSHDAVGGGAGGGRGGQWRGSILPSLSLLRIIRRQGLYKTSWRPWSVDWRAKKNIKRLFESQSIKQGNLWL